MPAPVDTDVNDELIQKIYNEVSITEKLDKLASSVETTWKIIWNYWRGIQSGDYQTVQKLKGEVTDKPLTTEGRLRLQARLGSIEEKAQPTFSKMVIQLWPLLAFYLIKTYALPMLSSQAKKVYHTKLKRKPAVAEQHEISKSR